MNNTPETDEKASVGLENADQECVPADFARKLERERDEARKDSEYYKERYEQLKDERDDAREALEEERKWHHQTHKELIEAQCKLLDIEHDQLKS